ncbi:MAG: enoyl-CoA hydratase/isomerase family protein [Acidobacteriota bacterium]|nr:enoyl-CoA hydratase/isomerase family protein [Acidobacteriota bacterium]
MTYETLTWETAGPVGTLTLNRPESLNAWTPRLGEELLAVLGGEAAEGAVRALIVTGAGRGFSSGADLKEGLSTLAADGMPDIRRELQEVYHPIISAMRELPKPVIAAVNGPAVGIGCSLALACDLILAAESAYLSLAFVRIGLMPDGGSTALVPPAVGKARAFEMTLLGERVSAAEALAWGLINRVHPDAELMEASRSLAGRLAAGPTRAYAAAKRALNRSLYPGFAEQLDLEAELQHELARSKDAAEGILAFVQKREPQFSGA